MYVSQKIRRAIVLSVMCCNLIVVPNFCPTDINMPMPMPVSVMSVAHAESKTYVGVGEYVVSNLENEHVAKERVKERAIKNAVEQANIYFISYVKVKNMPLTDDEIFEAMIVIAEVLEYKIEYGSNSEGFLKFISEATVRFDTDKFDEFVTGLSRN